MPGPPFTPSPYWGYGQLVANISGDLVSATHPLPVTVAGGGPPYTPTPLGYQQIISLSTAEALTVPSTATYALIQAEVAGVRWRDDGTAPTASIGMTLAAGGAPQTFSGDLAALQFIQIGAGAILNISYYK